MRNFIFALFLLSPLLSHSANREITLTTQNTVTFRGEVDDGPVVAAQLKLAELVAARGLAPYTIYLVLDTPGGSVVAGEDLIQFAKTLRNVETITLFAASMGSAIVEALPGRRLIVSTGTLMFHRAKGGFQGQFETGEVESRLEWAKKLVRNMEQRNADRMGLSLETYKSLVLNELWVYGEDNVTRGFADEVVEIRCTKELLDTHIAVSIGGLFGGSYAYSGCPLIRVPIAIEGEGGED